MVAVEFVAVFAAVAVAEAVVVVGVVVVVVVAVVVAAAAVVGERLDAISAVFEFVETEANKMLRYRHREIRQRRF